MYPAKHLQPNRNSDPVFKNQKKQQQGIKADKYGKQDPFQMTIACLHVTNKNSGKNAVYNFPTYISKTISSSQVFKDQLLMIQAHQIENSCLKIVNVNRIFDNV